MRLFLLLFGVLLVGTSCSKEDSTEELSAALELGAQKWELVSMRGSIANTETLIGDALLWQEYYIFNTDGSFEKYRDWTGDIEVASGTFEEQSYNGQTSLHLTYVSGNGLKASCGTTEVLSYTSIATLRGNWGECDGPTLEYNLIKQ